MQDLVGKTVSTRLSLSTDIIGARSVSHYAAENALQRKNRGPGMPQGLDPAVL